MDPEANKTLLRLSTFVVDEMSTLEDPGPELLGFGELVCLLCDEPAASWEAAQKRMLDPHEFLSSLKETAFTEEKGKAAAALVKKHGLTEELLEPYSEAAAVIVKWARERLQREGLLDASK